MLTDLSSFSAAKARHILTEHAAWKSIEGTWRPLHGGFYERGWSVEWHDFRLEQALDWARSFHSQSLEICLNFSGSAQLSPASSARAFGAREIAIYTSSEDRHEATRDAKSWHRFLTVELSTDFLRPHFASMLSGLKAPFRRFLESGSEAPLAGEILAMPASLWATRQDFMAPPVPETARDIWFLGRIWEILAQVLFEPVKKPELFCERHRRKNRERLEQVRFLLDRDLENPGSLEMLAQEIGCSPFYLSRIFAQEMGMSIPKYLRTRRIEKAAEMLRSGVANVTDAALAVGYSSLSAFNKAFVEQIGCCPGLYPHATLARGLARRARAS